MMKLGLALSFALLGLAPAQAQNAGWPPPAGALATLCVYNLVPPTLTTTNVGFIQCDATGSLRVAATITPSGTQNVNLTQVLGAAVSATNPVFVSPATGATWTAVQSTAASLNATVVGTGTFATQATPQASATTGAATTRASSTAAASSLVIKASAGNLYDINVTIGATTGYLMLFDATSLPSNGVVTPVFCSPIASDGTLGGASFAWPTPFAFTTGITAGFSTTGCFTLTASATAAFFGGYK